MGKKKSLSILYIEQLSIYGKCDIGSRYIETVSQSDGDKGSHVPCVGRCVISCRTLWMLEIHFYAFIELFRLVLRLVWTKLHVSLISRTKFEFWTRFTHPLSSSWANKIIFCVLLRCDIWLLFSSFNEFTPAFSGFLLFVFTQTRPTHLSSRLNILCIC